MSPGPSWSFLLDENVDKRLISALRAAGWSTAHISDNVLLQGRADTIIFRHACAQQQIIITHDTDYLNAAQFSPPHPGILILRFFIRKTSKELILAVLTALRPSLEETLLIRYG
jgi:predicted nuclease of predicted toxin-antitoxin system